MKDIKLSSVVNSWKKLLTNKDQTDAKLQDFHDILHQGSEHALTMEGTEQQLEANEDNPGYHILMKEEIVDSMTAAESLEQDEYDEADNTVSQNENISSHQKHLRYYMNYLCMK